MKLTYADFYRNLDGLIALQVASSTPLRRLEAERDTAFVKRIVATYLELAHEHGVHEAAVLQSARPVSEETR